MDPFLTFNQEDFEEEDAGELYSLFDALDVNTILSIEDYKELTNREQPTISDWKDNPVSSDRVDHIDVRFSFDKARRDAWDTAKLEIEAITSKARKLVGLSESGHPTDKQLF
jgi:hypothetical protein